MSFYGNIINYLGKSFKTVKGPGFEKTADDYNSVLDLTEDLKLSIMKEDPDNDGHLTYIIKQGGANSDNKIEFNIPLDLILQDALVETKTSDGVWGSAGVYIHLVFRTEEDTSKDVYINVTELNEIAGGDTDTIKVEVNEEQQITAKILNNSITITHLSEDLKTLVKKDSTIEQGNGIIVTKSPDDDEKPTTYTISHQGKPTNGSSETAEPGSGRTYITEVLVDDFGHIANVKTATETVVNTAHTHINGSGIKLTSENENGGIDGKVQLDLNIAMELDDKTIKIYDKDDTTKTAIATLDATDFIKDGMIESVELVNKDDKNNEGQFLKITWNIDDANSIDNDGDKDVVYVDVTKLVDVYTGGTTDDINVSISDNNEITATLNNEIKTTLSYVNTEKPITDAIEESISILESSFQDMAQEAVEKVLDDIGGAGGVFFTYDKDNRRLKISYTQEEN